VCDTENALCHTSVTRRASLERRDFYDWDTSLNDDHDDHDSDCRSCSCSCRAATAAFSSAFDCRCRCTHSRPPNRPEFKADGNMLRYLGQAHEIKLIPFKYSRSCNTRPPPFLRTSTICLLSTMASPKLIDGTALSKYVAVQTLVIYVHNISVL
jgi:hypothetical protein